MAVEREKWLTLMGGDSNVELLYFSLSLSSLVHSSRPLPPSSAEAHSPSPLELFGLGLIYRVNSAPPEL